MNEQMIPLSHQEREEEIKRFMESNKITKMALLDQRGDTDKEKQSITQDRGKAKRVVAPCGRVLGACARSSIPALHS